jgi:hypothetical protein
MRHLAAEADDRPDPTVALRTTARQASGRVGRRHNIKTATVINSRAQYDSRVKTPASIPLPSVTRYVAVRQQSDLRGFNLTQSDNIVRENNPC